MFSKNFFVLILFSVNTVLVLANDHQDRDYIDAKSAGRYRYFGKNNVRTEYQKNATRKQRSQRKIIVNHDNTLLARTASTASK